MDAFLIAIVASLLAEAGARTQRVSGWLSKTYQNRKLLLITFTLIVVASTSVAAIGGALLKPHMPPAARTMFLGFALIFAAFGQFRRGVPFKPLFPRSSFIEHTLHLGMAHLNDGVPFLVCAIAARSGHPSFAAVGAILVLSLLCIPNILMPDAWDEPTLFTWVRRVGGAILALSGLWCILLGRGVI